MRVKPSVLTASSRVSTRQLYPNFAHLAIACEYDTVTKAEFRGLANVVVNEPAPRGALLFIPRSQLLTSEEQQLGF